MDDGHPELDEFVSGEVKDTNIPLNSGSRVFLDMGPPSSIRHALLSDCADTSSPEFHTPANHAYPTCHNSHDGLIPLLPEHDEIEDDIDWQLSNWHGPNATYDLGGPWTDVYADCNWQSTGSVLIFLSLSLVDHLQASPMKRSRTRLTCCAISILFWKHRTLQMDCNETN